MMLILSKYIKLKIIFLCLRETLCILAKCELFAHRTYLVGSVEEEMDKGRDQKKEARIFCSSQDQGNAKQCFAQSYVYTPFVSAFYSSG